MTSDPSIYDLAPVSAEEPRHRPKLRLRLPAWAVRDQPVMARLAWAVVLLFVAVAMAELAYVGLMVRPAVFAWSEPVRIHAGIRDAFAMGNTVVVNATTSSPPGYRQLLAACKSAYDQTVAAHADQQYDLDYPPLRLLANTLWVWHVQQRYPDLHAWPFGRRGVGQYDAPVFTRDAWQNKTVHITEAQIAGPMLMLNTVAAAVAALAMLGLVWVWMERGNRSLREDIWAWGDPLLLVPVIVLLICQWVAPYVAWQPAIDDLSKLRELDLLIISPGFWIFLVLRFVAAIALVRFLPRGLRAPLCGLLAAAAIWLNPGVLLDGHGWPQWETWSLAFFTLAALGCAINRWTTAGVLLGIGCLCKGQLLLAAPVLIFCPLLAGWPRRFVRILGGVAFGSALVLWPWLVAQGAGRYWALGAAVLAVIVMSLLCRYVKPLRRLFILRALVLIAGASLWIGGLAQPAKQTWYTVAFQYGAAQPQALRTDQGLSNLPALMESRFDWRWDDVVTTIKFPGIQQPWVFNVINFTRAVYLLTLLICIIAAAIHFRRNDPKALAALAAPWVLFPTILAQMSARHTVLPACMAAVLLGLSTSLSLLQLLLTVLCCAMLGQDMLRNYPDFSPLAMRITAPAIPDLGWVMLLLAAMFLYHAVMPSRRPRLLE